MLKYSKITVCLYIPSKLSQPWFEFSLKGKVMRLNSGFLLKYFSTLLDIIITFSLYHVIVKFTKILKGADKNWAQITMTWYSVKISNTCGFMPNISQKNLEWYLVYLYGIPFFSLKKEMYILCTKKPNSSRWKVRWSLYWKQLSSHSKS